MTTTQNIRGGFLVCKKKKINKGPPFKFNGFFFSFKDRRNPLMKKCFLALAATETPLNILYSEYKNPNNVDL